MKHLIMSGRTKKPINMLLHGVHGIGKSTFASKAPKPIFITGEEIEEIDSDKFPKCTTWNEFLDYLKYLRDEKHDYKTLVIDTVDSIEALLWKHILKEDGSEDMARALGGFGKAYALATQRFANRRDEYLVPIRDKKGMNIISLCHSTKNKFEDPMTQTSYDTWEMKLHKSGKGLGAYTVFSEWVSIIAFANFEVYTVKDKTSDKNYAVGEGRRLMHLTPRPAYDAKNRYDLPDEMELSWDALEKAVNDFYENTKSPEAQALRNEVYQMIDKIEDKKLKEKTKQNVESVGYNVARLTKAKEFIQGAING